MKTWKCRVIGVKFPKTQNAVSLDGGLKHYKQEGLICKRARRSGIVDPGPLDLGLTD